MSSHLVPSFEQLERTSEPTNYDYNETSPRISKPPAYGPASSIARKTRFHDHLGPGILKCVIFFLGLACAVSFGSVTMTVGNEILANTHPKHSTKTETAAIVGSIGGIFAYGLPLLCYLSLDAIHRLLREQGLLVVLTILTITNFACAAVLGPIGCIIYLKLAKHSSDLGGLNIRNATLMSIIGGSFWMILLLGLSSYLNRTPKNETENWNTTTRYQEQCRDLDIAFARR